MPHRIGVCSWSLQPAGPADLAERIHRAGIAGVQLALDPIRDGRWDLAETAKALRSAGITLLSGMMEMAGEDYSSLESIARTGGVRPDATWGLNRAAAARNAEIAANLGLSLVTFHAGVIPHDRADRERGKILSRVSEIVDMFLARDIRVAFETGQESARVMLDVLAELDRDERLGVNFDPANMILYGTGDPIEALADLIPHVVQVHIKDARWAGSPGTWGTEVVAGTGEVDWDSFCALIERHRPDIDVVIEREWGDARVEDVRTARAMLASRLAGACA